MKPSSAPCAATSCRASLLLVMASSRADTSGGHSTRILGNSQWNSQGVGELLSGRQVTNNTARRPPVLQGLQPVLLGRGDLLHALAHRQQERRRQEGGRNQSAASLPQQQVISRQRLRLLGC
jgi:hypothetical protein